VVIGLRSVLEPPLPQWRDAARGFWEFTSGDAGMPGQLVVTCDDDPSDAGDAGGHELVLGTGTPRYVISGAAEKLARVFTGTDALLDEVFAGTVAVRGTLPQLSVMAGASLKVRFHA
jgi:hypothetical protein